MLDVKVIRVTANTDLEHLLEEAENDVLILEKDGVRYRLTKEREVAASDKTMVDYEALLAAAGSWENGEDMWVDYDPTRTRDALRDSVGALRGVDRQELIAEIHRAREQGSPGRPDSE